MTIQKRKCGSLLTLVQDVREGMKHKNTFNFEYSHIGLGVGQRQLAASMLRELEEEETWSLESNFLRDMTKENPNWRYSDVVEEELRRGANRADYYGVKVTIHDRGGRQIKKEYGSGNESLMDSIGGEESNSSSCYADAQVERTFLTTVRKKKEEEMRRSSVDEQYGEKKIDASLAAEVHRLNLLHRSRYKQ